MECTIPELLRYLELPEPEILFYYIPNVLALQLSSLQHIHSIFLLQVFYTSFYIFLVFFLIFYPPQTPGIKKEKAQKP